MKHFLSLLDYSPQELQHLLNIALKLKAEYRAGGNKPILQGKTLAMLFQKPSLRTRVSFELGMVHLGGYALSLSPQEVKMGTRETPADVARVLSGYVSAVMGRVLSHNDIMELAENATIPIINGLSDYNHPAQTLTDLLTILECRGTLAGQRVVYVGDGNNVSRSLFWGAMMTGVNFAIASPAGYMLSEEDFDTADQIKANGARFDSYIDPIEAVKNADVIYTDVWTSMGQEEETAARLQVFPPYQINEKLLSHAKPDAIVMHCLPAHRGEEITDNMLDGARSVVFHQAENRLHAQKAILAYLLAPEAVKDI